MKIFNLVSLMLMALTAFFTWTSVEASPQRVHIMENLSPEEGRIAEAMMIKKGYSISRKPIFSETVTTVVITKTIATELDSASIQVEMVKMDREKSLPKTTYQINVPTDKIEDAINQFPSSAILTDQIFMPVAYQSHQ